MFKEVVKVKAEAQAQVKYLNSQNKQKDTQIFNSRESAGPQSLLPTEDRMRSQIGDKLEVDSILEQHGESHSKEFFQQMPMNALVRERDEGQQSQQPITGPGIEDSVNSSFT